MLRAVTHDEPARRRRNAMDKGLWDVRAVGEFLSVPSSWVYAAAERGELPAFKVGRYLRFDPGTVRTWLESRRRQPVEGGAR
jgi:excisionase family DNA binding protein